MARSHQWLFEHMGLVGGFILVALLSANPPKTGKQLSPLGESSPSVHQADWHADAELQSAQALASRKGTAAKIAR